MCWMSTGRKNGLMSRTQAHLHFAYIFCCSVDLCFKVHNEQFDMVRVMLFMFFSHVYTDNYMYYRVRETYKILHLFHFSFLFLSGGRFTIWPLL